VYLLISIHRPPTPTDSMAIRLLLWLLPVPPLLLNNNSIQFIYLFMCRLYSPEANYKVSVSREEKTHIQRKYKSKAILIIIIIPLTQIKMKS
jgi:hypothetical protein